MKFSFKSLRVQSILLILALIIPVNALNIYHAIQDLKMDIQTAKMRSFRAAKNISVLYSDILRGGRNLLQTLSLIEIFRNNDTKRILTIFAELKKQTHFYSGFCIAKANGEVFASLPGVKGVNLVDRPHFNRAATKRQFAIGEYMTGRISGKEIITLAYPVLNAHRQHLTIISAELDLKAIERIVLSEVVLPPGALLTVIDSDGTIIHRPRQPQFVGKTLPENGVIRAMLSQREGIVEATGPDGESRVLGFTTLGEGVEAIHLGVGIPTKTIIAPALQHMVFKLAWITLLTALAVLGAWFLWHRKIQVPIHRLVGLTKAVAQGDFNLRREMVNDGGEIGELTRHFDEMTQMIQQREEMLRDRERRFRSLFENYPIQTIIVDFQGRVTEFNLAKKLSGDRLPNMGDVLYKDYASGHALDMYAELIRCIESGVQKQFPELKYKDRYLAVSIAPFAGGAIVSALDITERRRAVEEQLRLSEELRLLLQSTGEGIYGSDVKGRFIFINKAGAAMLGYSEEELIRKDIHSLIHHHYADGSEYPPEKCPMRHTLISGEGIHAEDVLWRKDGSSFPVIYSSFPITQKGEIKGVVVTFTDITDRKAAEDQIMTSLKEKEILLQEVHHRVKNNMMVITSLLRLQSNKLQDENTREIFQECERRVKSMAMIHNQLYQTKDFAFIDFNSHLKELSKYLFQTCRINRDIVSLTYEAQGIKLDINTAIPLGLLLNELISNSLKHAFPGGRKGQITVSLQKEEKENILVVADNGVGLPEAIDITRTQSMGLQLVTALVQQLNGTIEMKRNEGTVWTITFPAEK